MRSAREGGRRARSSERAVTLVEVLISLGIAMALLATAFVFVQDLLRARDRIERLTRRERSMDLFLDALDQAAASSVLDAGGVEGDAVRCTIWSASSDPSRLARSGASPFPAFVAASFGFEEEEGSLRIRRGDAAEESLPAEIFALRFRYHDGFEWIDEFDGAARRRLPAAIEVSLWTVPWPDDARPSWLPEPTPVDESTDELDRGGALAAFRTEPPLSFDDEANPDGPPVDGAGDRSGAGIAADRELTQAPAPERRRVIVVPDSAPATLIPISTGASR